ncbi:hypothetical protein Tco_0565815 [Tanacetum coccineum]
MTTLKFVDTHNKVAFLSKPTESEGFEQIVDFLNANPIRYAIMINPTIYTSCIKQFWATVKVKTVNGEVQLQALVDGKKIIVTEASVRRDLQLDDEEGTDCLPNATIFEELTRMGYEKLSQKLTFYKAFFSPQWKFLIHTILQCLSAKTTIWNEFSSTMASAIICLATNQKFNFSKYIFESMVKNLDNVGKFLMYPRKPKRKDTEIPQSSVPSDNVADEAVNEKMDDSLVRAATTASSLEVEQDSGNIDKTQSKSTPNEQSSLGTSLGDGPRRQETMGDTIAQTKFENVSKTSNDPLLARGNTLRSGEDSLKLEELIAFYITLQTRVLALETTKTTQVNEINTRVKPSEDEGLGENDASKQGRIADIDANQDIYLVNVQTDEDIFGVNDLYGDKVLAEPEVVVKDVNLSDDEVNLAQALAALKSAKVQGKTNVVEEPSESITKTPTLTTTTATTTITAVSTRPRAKGLVIHEQEQAPTPIVSSQQPSQVKAQDKGKGIMVEEPMLAQRLQAQEQEELTIAEKARLFVQFLEQRRKHFAAKRAEEKRNKPPTRAKQRSIMCTYLKNMGRWKPKDLKNKSFANIQELFDKAMKRVNTFVDYRTELVEESSKKADVEIAQESRR